MHAYTYNRYRRKNKQIGCLSFTFPVIYNSQLKFFKDTNNEL